jgi:acetyl-CoA carboxylase biotin carboxyl carrier protein
MNLTQEEILLILKILKDSEFDELDLKVGGLSMRARRKGAGGAPSGSPPLPEADPPPMETAGEGQIPSRIPAPDARGSLPREGLIPIKAPILGTFYRRPSPKDPPFVEVGTFVNEDDTVCLIEVMKVFSTIKAGLRGRIEEICVETGDLVEFGQALFLVKPEPPQ